MVPAVTSSSAALTVLKTVVPPQTASAQQDQDPVHRFLDPRSVLALPPQSFDALLQLSTHLRRDQTHGSQAQQGVPMTSSKGTPGQSGMLAWENESTPVQVSYFDQWTEQMESLKALSPELLNHPLMPWNSPDLIQQMKDRDLHANNSAGRERQLRESDTAIYRSMTETPPEDVTRIKAAGGEIWYERTQLRDQISDKEFFRDIKNYALYDVDLRQPIDPSSKLSQAFLSGTAQIIRGSKTPEVKYKLLEYTYYAYNSEGKKYKWVGGFSGENFNEAYLRDLEKKNPTMNVTSISADNDIAFILYPKSGTATPASAVAQSGLTGKGTKAAAAPAR